MSLKKSIRKLTAITAAMLIIHSNCYMFGLSLSKVIAQDIKEPNVNLSLENTQYVQFKEELEKQTTNSEESEEAERQYNSGVAIKAKLQLSLEEQETNLPIKNSEIVVNMPTINECLPERVSIATASTELTTGENNNQKINQNYDSNSGLLTISYGNESTYSNYNKESKDEFEIIYIYPGQAYTGNEEEISLQYSVVAKVNFETENATTTAEKVQVIELTEKENKGTLLTFGVTKLENDIYKGFMYSNVENKNSYDTDYNSISTLCVLNSNASNELTMSMGENKFVLNNKENTEVSSKGKLLYKSTEISKTEFDKILGQEGSIEIYNEETLLATVRYIDVNENKKTVKKLAIIYSDENIKTLSDEETTAKIEFGEGVKSLIIKTTKPVSEGYINFKNENTIKASENYNVDVSELKSIKTKTVMNNNEENVELLLLEPETKISVNSSNINFSTLQINKTTLIIKLDDTNASTKLFDNPTIKVTLPEGLKYAKPSSPEILNGNGLTIKETTGVNNVLTIKLEGKQTKYDLTNVSGGTSIVVDLEDIDFEDTLPTHKDNITVTCLQNDEQVVTSNEVNIISKAGLLVLSNVTGIENNKTIISIDSEPKVTEIKNNEEEKQITQTINLVNNYDSKITNTQIIGKIGYTDDELKSTFDLELSKAIEVDNGKVYYSTNKNATYNDSDWTEEYTSYAKAYKIELSNSELESKAITQIKIHLKTKANIDYNQKTYVKTQISYTYKEQYLSDSSTFGMTTPENSFGIYSMSSEMPIETEKGKQNLVNVTVTPVISQAYVHSGQTVTYKITVANNGTETLNNINLEDQIPNNAIYTYVQETEGLVSNYNTIVKDAETKTITWEIEKLEPNTIREVEIMLTMADVTEEQEIKNTVNLKYNSQTITTESKLKLKPAKILATLETNGDSLINKVYDYEDTVQYYLKVKNTTNSNLKNINVQFELPESIEYVDGGEATYDEYEGYILDESKKTQLSENLLIYTINKLDKDKEITILINTKVKKLTSNFETKIEAIANAQFDGEIYETNLNTVKTIQSSLDAKLECNVDNNNVLNENDEVIYTITVKNNGLTSGFAMITDDIPEQLEVYKLENYLNNEKKSEEETDDSNITITQELNEDDELKIKIYTKVLKAEAQDGKDKISVENKAIIKFNAHKIETESVQIIIKAENEPEYEDEDDEEIDEDDEDEDIDDDDDYENNNNGDENNPSDGNNGEDNQPEEDNRNDDDNPPSGNDNEENNPPAEDGNKDDNSPSEDAGNEEVKKYLISGTAWLDANKNGARDDGETLLENLKVKLINMTTGNYVTGEDGNVIVATTDAQGKYTFNDMPQGTYTVVFEFDTNTYTVTTYKKDGVSETSNSDVIISTVTAGGQSNKVGITDKIELSSNKENIDMGLIENAVFDLSLNKQITQITVVDKQGTENYTYKDGHTAKVDLVAKYMNGANVFITYKFTIKNEGDVVGYVNSLLDTLPSGLEFSSEVNKEWYKDSDGKLYTTSLSGKAIKPGESTEIELVLTKTMTEENAGTFPNSAELDKISNLENIGEKEDAKENNESSAILIISIKTGSIILYIGITLMCTAIIGLGAYLINKKVLKEGI